jgi:uncharacterized protein (TIGR02231 family)
VSDESEHTLDAPVAAVTVYADRARVTRRGALHLPAGEQRVLVDRLPLGLHPDSIRVSGVGPATVLGVDVVRRHHARTPHEATAALEHQLRVAQAALAELADADAVQQEREDFLAALSRRAGRTYADALAAGGVLPADIAAFTDALTAQAEDVRSRRRGLTSRRDALRDEIAAFERRLAGIRKQRDPDRMAAVIGLDVSADVSADAEVELEVVYVVDGASWQPTYDIRLDGDRLTLTWFALVSQHTGEDWPECELELSTARPSGAVTVPELDPWYLDRIRPVPAGVGGLGRAARAPGPMELAMPAPAAAQPAAEGFADFDEPMREISATIEQGVAAATYRPARPVAVPADGGAHRATVAALDLAATLDYITAPVRGPEAHLRATATNTSAHTLLPGRAAVFHGGDFVGTTELETWAPGEEVELALGLDDRVRVERELVRRSATKATLGSTRRREVEYRISVANHTPRPARVTVLDQIPVSRDEGITVKELRAEPAPAGRSDLGVLTWKLELAPAESREILLGMRVELAKGVEMAGWRE